MEENDKYISYYDQFSTDPKKKEISTLHSHVLDKLVAEGLKSNHKVLEGGSGLGELSNLIAQKVKNGLTLGVDINENNVSKATKLWEKQKNLHFVKAELKAFESQGETYDYFVLSEIIQQVTTDKHLALFEAVRRHSHEDTVIFINLPTPPFAEWKAENDPESLQFVESTINLSGLIESLAANDFYLQKVVPYSVFYEEADYQYFIFKPIKRLESPALKRKWALSKDKISINPLNLL
ncbi:hypothetical protein GCM10007049_24700 [Echinicola pacifica]|uniref:Methyltransferase domain-containing protein n=1 Tax=Echinicola pacifica TaxID=346377 RepID=A0A918Q213_9BACT|nr:class I SAM-dependent methyltransferase [Echinicola pacifica]GGZ30841.1 hypothetical protein GCM10007049_24700 [Echinicola pacifica]